MTLVGDVVCGTETGGLLEASGDDIVVVVTTVLVVGLLELVKGTTLALVLLTAGLSVKSKLLCMEIEASYAYRPLSSVTPPSEGGMRLL